ncbi:hypothetical protein E2C01_090674 [Portunus trituberculatus]|uniref:Uncharacterized protein n=1 Tax=Portunus trituberculatus TaxID=210409 RepID=A0A5B7JH90_PORTR|nr:hypothetical protein [Portunus trituberculatus]
MYRCIVIGIGIGGIGLFFGYRYRYRYRLILCRYFRYLKGIYYLVIYPI